MTNLNTDNMGSAAEAQKYYERLPLWPDFDVVDKNIDGLIPAARIESWEKFDDLIAPSLGNGDRNDYVYRGQQHYKWFLKSSLDRFNTPAIDKDFAHRHLQNFRLSIRGRVPDNSILNFDVDNEDGLEDVDLWAAGQHHGLATPLLDWTRSPYVALFFAFEKEDHPDWIDEKRNPNNYSRTIFVLNETFIRDLEGDYDPKFPRVVEPSKDDHGRLVNQAGLFTLAPYGETLESSLLYALTHSEVDVDNPSELAKYICKIHIPNGPNDRQNCLRWLRKMNIHHASLFPDLIGASGYCNELARELIARRELIPKPSATEKTTGEKLISEGSSNESDINFENLGAVITVEPTKLIDLIANALLVDDKLKQKGVTLQFRNVARETVEFVSRSAGVDWFARDSELARIRTFVKRQLSRIDFDPDLIREASVNAVIELAASYNPGIKSPHTQQSEPQSEGT